MLDYHQWFPELWIFSQLITKEYFNGYGLLRSIPDVPDYIGGDQIYFSKGMGKDETLCLIKIYSYLKWRNIC